jgi:hypothetical protein
MIARLARPSTGDSMSLLSKKAVVLLVAALAGFGALNAQAAKKNASTEKVSMLDGKFTFVLPKGFVADPLPTSPSGATGTMYTNEATKTVVITAQNTIPEGQHVKDNDGEVPRWQRGEFHRRPAQGTAGLQQTQRKKPDPERHGPWPASGRQHRHPGRRPDPQHHADGRLRHDMALVQVISRASDKKGHDALVKTILKD